MPPIHGSITIVLANNTAKLSLEKLITWLVRGRLPRGKHVGQQAWPTSKCPMPLVILLDCAAVLLVAARPDVSTPVRAVFARWAPNMQFSVNERALT